MFHVEHQNRFPRRSLDGCLRMFDDGKQEETIFLDLNMAHSV